MMQPTRTTPSTGPEGTAVPDADVRRIAPDPLPTLVVSEMFLTIQGEGPSTGQRAAFVRLGGCNLHCVWCDTPYTWDADRYDLRTQMARRSVADIAHDLAAMNPRLVVITGGEPMLQQDYPGFETLITLCGIRGIRVEIETNGTIAPAPWLAAADHVAFNVSPKLAHAGDPLDKQIVPAALAALRDTGRAVFKFVVRHDRLGMACDLGLVDVHTAVLHIEPDAVWVMPEGRTRESIIHATTVLAEPVIERGYNLATRLHVILWDDERGR